MDREREHARTLWAELDRRQKWDYFWGYYNIHVWIGLFVTSLIGMTVYDCATRVDPDITIFYVGTELSDEALTELGAHLSTVIADSNHDGRAIVSLMRVVEEQKLYVTFAAGDIHLLLMRREEFLRYADNAAFRPLEPVLEELGIELELRAFPEIGLTPQEAQEAHIYGIPLEQNTLFTGFGAAMQHTYLAIPVRGMFGSADAEQTRYANVMALVQEILAHSAHLR